MYKIINHRVFNGTEYVGCIESSIRFNTEEFVITEYEFHKSFIPIYVYSNDYRIIWVDEKGVPNEHLNFPIYQILTYKYIEKFLFFDNEKV